MKKFIKRVIFFVIPIIILVAIGEYLARQVPNSYSLKNQLIQRNADKVEILILGSSHTYYGVCPNEFDVPTINLANSSQHFEYDDFLLHKYSSQYKSLHTIIISADYDNLFVAPFEGRDEDYRCIYYKLYMDYPRHSAFSKYGFEFSNPYIWLGKLKRYNEFRRTGEIFIGCDSLGWGIHESEHTIDTNQTKIASATLANHTCHNFETLNYNIPYLENIATFCKSHKIRLILISTPTWQSYYSGCDNIQLQKTHEEINKIVKKFGAEYFDYMRDTRFSITDFNDCDHLSESGAKKFTQILITETNLK